MKLRDCLKPLLVALAVTCASLGAQAVPLHSGQKVLLVFPHPDDEAMIRSVISRMVEAGQSVYAIYLTRGEGGKDARWVDDRNNYELPADVQAQRQTELAATRTQELKNASQIYELKGLYQLNIPDEPYRDPVTHVPTRDPSVFLREEGGPWPVSSIKSQIQEIAEKIEPDMVISFFPGQPGTHAHHQATGQIVESMYADHRLGSHVNSVYGFYENLTVDASDKGLASAMKLNSLRLSMTPNAISQTAPNQGKTYGEIGTRGLLSHVSQLKGETGEFVRNWSQNPDEVLAPMIPGEGLYPLLSALGDVPGIQAIGLCEWDLSLRSTQ